MAILTLRAAPAGRTTYGTICQIVTFGTAPQVTRKVEVKTAADCVAAFNAFRDSLAADEVAKLAAFYGKTASAGDVPGANLYAMIFKGDGRKPAGFDALALEAFIEAKQVAA